MTNRTWTTWLASATLSAAVAVGGMVVTSQQSDAAPAEGGLSGATTSSVTDATDAVAATSTPSVDSLDALDAGSDADFSVSVVDVATGTTLSYGDGTYDTASIVKVDILAALLAQHDEAGTDLTDNERSLAAAMIEQSDNDAATTLFAAAGGEAGVEAFNESIGLTGTDVGADGYWGLTQTTADDQVALLQTVFGDASVLSDASQAYVSSLMSDVIDSQNFGVSAAADDADEAAVKVGYLQRSATGLWDVTSIGEIEAYGRTYYVAVLSDGSATYDGGVDLVDSVARAAVEAVAAI